ncbi:MAG: hypothetical protein HWD60_00040 [Defluviicoccus sp.]|nr:MAG: hypothetical protein HWD60_00040 [Defluviicoccus sp.]
MESLAFEMGREGPANGTVQLVAQGEEKAAATIDATPAALALKRFSQGRGFIKRSGSSWPVSPAAASPSPTTWNGCG